MKDIISYAKEAQEAFKNYINSGDVDFNLRDKVYADISRIETLDNDSREELDEFINNYGSKEIPLFVGLNFDRFSKFFRGMLPLNLSRDNKGIYSARGNFTSVVTDKSPSFTVKVKRKTYAKKSA